MMAIVGSAASKPIRIRNQLVEGWPTRPDLPPIDDRANNLRVRFPGWNSFAKRFVADGCRPPNCVCVWVRALSTIFWVIFFLQFFFCCAELPPSCFQYLLREMFLAQNLFFKDRLSRQVVYYIPLIIAQILDGKSALFPSFVWEEMLERISRIVYYTTAYASRDEKVTAPYFLFFPLLRMIERSRTPTA